MDKYTEQRIPALHPKYRKAFTDFINEIDSTFKTSFRIVQGFRTFAEQDDIYAQGRTKPGKIVTNAKGGQSFHCFGCAIDVVPIVNGDADWNFDFKKVEPIAAKYGLYWGGNFKDYDHFEIKDFTWKALLALHNAGKVDKDGYVLI